MTERQQQLVQNVEKHRQMILDAERWLWAHPQTGYTEWEAHNYLVEKYEALGYTLTLAGNIPGFYTEVDTGRPGPKLAIWMPWTSPITPNRSMAWPIAAVTTVSLLPCWASLLP